MKKMKKILGFVCSVLFCTNVFCQNNAIFFGGTADGWNSKNLVQTSSNIFTGGIADGWSTKNYNQAGGNIFKGGVGDGWENKNYIQSSLGIFKGGVGDGWEYKSYIQTSLGIFKGGVGDGWDYKNYIQASLGIFKGGVGDGWASDYKPQGPVPVNFLWFTATKFNEKQALLNWKTAQEINSAYFQIERSNDALIFKSIGSVQAAGNSSVAVEYSFTDLQPANGLNYYRLKQVDLDGRFIYTPTRVIRFNEPDAGLVKYFPNPTRGLVYIELSNAMASESKIINISTAAGVVVNQVKLGAVSNNIISINLDKYARGIYFIQIKTPTANSTQRIILQ